MLNEVLNEVLNDGCVVRGMCNLRLVVNIRRYGSLLVKNFCYLIYLVIDLFFFFF